MAGRYSISPASKVTRMGCAKCENLVAFSFESMSQVTNGTVVCGTSSFRTKPSACRTYVAPGILRSFMHGKQSGGSNVKCFLPRTWTKMFSKLSLCVAVTDLELPIHMLIASGPFSSAIRANGTSFGASGSNDAYSSLKLSFSGRSL